MTDYRDNARRLLEDRWLRQGGYFQPVRSCPSRPSRSLWWIWFGAGFLVGVNIVVFLSGL